MKKVLSTTRQVEFIHKYKFVEAKLDKSFQSFLANISSLAAIMTIHLLKKT